MYTAWWLKTLGCKELKEFGLTHEQFNVLRILKGKHPEQMCVKDIAGRMIEKNSNVPRILDRLEEKKLIERAQGAEDARQTVMSLTEQGIELLASSSCRMDTTMAENTTMSEEDAQQLNLLLEKFRALES